MNNQWCLVRWMSGYTQAKLRARRDGYGLGSDPLTGASFCGPLAAVEDERYQGAGLGRLGFPSGSVGEIALFASEEAAARHAENGHISVDVPTPLEALHFSATEFSYWDGLTRFLYDGGDYLSARGELRIRMGQFDSFELQRLKHEIDCHPLYERLGRHRPTIEQARAMYAVSERLDREHVAWMLSQESA